jgi:hypothetical protein
MKYCAGFTFLSVAIMVAVPATHGARVCNARDFGARCTTRYEKPPDATDGILAALHHCLGNATVPSGIASLDNQCTYSVRPFTMPEGARLDMGGCTIAALDPSDPEAFVREHYYGHADSGTSARTASGSQGGGASDGPPAIVTLSSGAQIFSYGGLSTIDGRANSDAWARVSDIASERFGLPGPSALAVRGATGVSIGNIVLLNPVGAALNVSQSDHVTSEAQGQFNFPSETASGGGLYIWGSNNIIALSAFQTHPQGPYGHSPGVTLVPDSMQNEVANVALWGSHPEGVRVHVPAWGGSVSKVSVTSASKPPTPPTAFSVRSDKYAASKYAASRYDGKEQDYTYTPLLTIDTVPGARGSVTDITIGGFSDPMMGPVLIVDQWGGAASPPAASTPAVRIGAVKVSEFQVGRGSSQLCGSVRCASVGSCPGPIDVSDTTRTVDGAPNYWECANVVLTGSGNTPALPRHCNSTSS